MRAPHPPRLSGSHIPALCPGEFQLPVWLVSRRCNLAGFRSGLSQAFTPPLALMRVTRLSRPPRARDIPAQATEALLRFCYGWTVSQQVEALSPPHPQHVTIGRQCLKEVIMLKGGQWSGPNRM